MALSVDVDRFSDAYMIDQYAGVLKADDGHVVQVPHERQSFPGTGPDRARPRAEIEWRIQCRCRRTTGLRNH